MGAQVSQTDYEWVYTEEPHATRRKEILGKNLCLRECQLMSYENMSPVFIFYTVQSPWLPEAEAEKKSLIFSPMMNPKIFPVTCTVFFNKRGSRHAVMYFYEGCHCHSNDSLALIVSGDYSIMMVLTIVISKTWRGCRRIKSSDGDDKNGERMCVLFIENSLF